MNERTNGSWIDGMNDWMGDVTPVLTVCGGEAYL